MTLQLLSFRLVDSAFFEEFAECAVPPWKVPLWNYFARQFIPSLYHHVEGNVTASLGKVISSRVHLVGNTWSSKKGQGHYISFIAHWVTLLVAEMDAQQDSVWSLLCHGACILVVLLRPLDPHSPPLLN